MSLAALLPRVRRGTDLRLLVRPLLDDSRWERLDARALDPDGSGGVLSAGSWPAARGLPWITLEARDAGHAARMVARACAAAGRPAGILCLDAAHRRLAIAAATPEAPGVVIAMDRPDPLALAVLDRLPALRGADALAALARLADAMEMEPLGTRFFRQFRRVFARFTEALPPGPPAADRHALALLQLTRVLFLYFVQSKGWLDGRSDFLARAVDDCLERRRPLHPGVLRTRVRKRLRSGPSDLSVQRTRLGDPVCANRGMRIRVHGRSGPAAGRRQLRRVTPPPQRIAFPAHLMK